MTRQITGITAELAKEISEKFPRLGIIENHINDDWASLILDDAVIIKIYSDEIMLDLGKQLIEIPVEDFVSIEIR